jgi:hypothetical protein
MTGASRTDPCLPDTMAARSRPGATGEHGEPAVRAVRTAVTVHGGTCGTTSWALIKKTQPTRDLTIPLSGF